MATVSQKGVSFTVVNDCLVQMGLTLTASLRNTGQHTPQRYEGSGNVFTTAKIKEKIPPSIKLVLIVQAEWGVSVLEVKCAQKCNYRCLFSARLFPFVLSSTAIKSLLNIQYRFFAPR